MPTRTPILTDKAPVPRTVYSQAIVANGFVFCSGQIGKNPATGQMVSGTVKDRHCHQTIENLGRVLEAAGSSLNDVVEVDVFLTARDDFAAVNEVYLEYFGELKPARTCVIVKELPSPTDIETKCTGLITK
ncbi:hypothetical protein CEP51_005180 [Fusarium floridanum]|uniref:2-iminobutanoate/2-iminopropanoate deaminase n=1 Tax=Fusarium floridanum TaxID=1325733 RepID=A0A428RY25_9HYPO|nr:hypothetical protein CEP51_005180 [Fusarium floridanum]